MTIDILISFMTGLIAGALAFCYLGRTNTTSNGKTSQNGPLNFSASDIQLASSIRGLSKIGPHSMTDKQLINLKNLIPMALENNRLSPTDRKLAIELYEGIVEETVKRVTGGE